MRYSLPLCQSLLVPELQKLKPPAYVSPSDSARLCGGAQFHPQWGLGWPLLLQSDYLEGEGVAGPESPWTLRCYSLSYPLYLLPPANPLSIWLYACLCFSTVHLHGLELALDSHLWLLLTSCQLGGEQSSDTSLKGILGVMARESCAQGYIWRAPGFIKASSCSDKLLVKSLPGRVFITLHWEFLPPARSAYWEGKIL